MKITCLCPTFRRPARLLENAIACFEAQDYPAANRHLIVSDDAAQYAAQSTAGWSLVSRRDRFRSLPEKYNALLEATPQGGVIAIWEDDDIYLPWHLSAAMEAMRRTGSPWSKPSRVGTMCRSLREVAIERADGRFHASLVIRRDFLLDLGGWPETRRADFDLQLIARLAAASAPADPCAIAPPSYIFRWASTGSPHGQGFGRGPADDAWYDRAGAAMPVQPFCDRVTPRLDEETAAILAAPGG